MGNFFSSPTTTTGTPTGTTGTGTAAGTPTGTPTPVPRTTCATVADLGTNGCCYNNECPPNCSGRSTSTQNGQPTCECTGCPPAPATPTPVIGTCTETASVSVQADRQACAAVTELTTSTACEAVKTAANNDVRACTYSVPSSGDGSFFGIDFDDLDFEKALKYLINGIFALIWIIGTFIAIKNGLKCGAVFKNKMFNFFKAIIFGPLYAIWLRFSCKPHLF